MDEVTPIEKITDFPAFKTQCQACAYKLTNADFTNAALGKAILCGDVDSPSLTLNHPLFIKADLRLAHCLKWKMIGGKFEGNHCEGAQFHDCMFSDMVFKDVDYFDSNTPVDPARFLRCEMHFVTFEGPLRDVVFKDCALRGAKFTNCALARVSFLSCDLTGADFEHASMERVDLQDSTLTPGQLKDAEADDWSTVRVAGTGMTIEVLRGES